MNLIGRAMRLAGADLLAFRRWVCRRIGTCAFAVFRSELAPRYRRRHDDAGALRFGGCAVAATDRLVGG